MRNSLWIPVFILLFAGPARAQDNVFLENEETGITPGQNIPQSSGSLISDSKAENEMGGPTELPPLTAKEKLRSMIRATYEPKSIMFSIAGAGMKQAMNSIPEWGQGMEGFGKRLASTFGHRIIRRDIQLGLGMLLHEDPRYFYSERQGIGPRALFAASRTFVSNKDCGGIRPGYSKFIATFGGSYISRQWHPERKQTMSEYAASSAISFGLDTVKNVFTEFWPDIKKRLHR